MSRAGGRYASLPFRRVTNIMLATDPAMVKVGSALEKEMKYLLEKGYKIVRDVDSGSWRFVR